LKRTHTALHARTELSGRYGLAAVQLARQGCRPRRLQTALLLHVAADDTRSRGPGGEAERCVRVCAAGKRGDGEASHDGNHEDTNRLRSHRNPPESVCGQRAPAVRPRDCSFFPVAPSLRCRAGRSCCCVQPSTTSRHENCIVVKWQREPCVT
jgi:hypothetical protein